MFPDLEFFFSQSGTVHWIGGLLVDDFYYVLELSVANYLI